MNLFNKIKALLALLSPVLLHEAGKGDHRHFDDMESRYSFTTPEALLAAFEQDIARWNHENRHP